MAYAYGKRTPKGAPALQFAKYSKTVAATFPPVDYLGQVDWSATMNGNDSFGDCVSCAVVNTVLLISTVLGGLPVRATLDEVVAFYRTQNPDFDINGTDKTNGPGSNADGGMDEQTACETLVKDGITIGGKVYKALGFAKVDHANLAEIKAAVSTGGSLLLGVQVAAAQQTQFPNVWDFVASSPIEGGHAIVGGGHLDVTSDDVKAVCWASEFGTTDSFLSHQLDECWLIIWPWHVGSKEFIAGMDLAAFAADFTAITGDPFPAVIPAPAPVTPPVVTPPVVVTPPPVVPTPAPVPDLAAAVAEAYAVAGTWVNGPHVGTTKKAAQALKAVFVAAGLMGAHEA